MQLAGLPLAVGVALAAGTLGQVTPAFVELARNSGTGPCKIIGHDLWVAPAVAALVNGAMSHALDYEDTHDGGLVHPNGTALPAALAIAQLVGPVSGRDFITAIAVAAEAAMATGMFRQRPMARLDTAKVVYETTIVPEVPNFDATRSPARPPRMEPALITASRTP